MLTMVQMLKSVNGSEIKMIIAMGTRIYRSVILIYVEVDDL